MINRLGEFFPEKSGLGQPVVWHTMLCPFKQDWPKIGQKIGRAAKNYEAPREIFFSSEISFLISF